MFKKVVWATEAWVQTRDEDGRVGPRERLVVIRTVDQEPRVWYALSNAPAAVDGFFHVPSIQEES